MISLQWDAVTLSSKNSWHAWRPTTRCQRNWWRNRAMRCMSWRAGWCYSTISDLQSKPITNMSNRCAVFWSCKERRHLDTVTWTSATDLDRVLHWILRLKVSKFLQGVLWPTWVTSTMMKDHPTLYAQQRSNQSCWFTACMQFHQGIAAWCRTQHRV